ncbi:hypothetical protein PoB_002510300 [Plakobranchus ocellatus]|uniref:Uncharacterized protein n=1 Tax=Plakobranchus ocellatus TaxID=259542 RepID=A0AAV3ZUP3_9GAST|nr:hypothetical protein PoB_002510300 [Plakobranchus ocellatus]
MFLKDQRGANNIFNIAVFLCLLLGDFRLFARSLRQALVLARTCDSGVPEYFKSNPQTPVPPPPTSGPFLGVLRTFGPRCSSAGGELGHSIGSELKLFRTNFLTAPSTKATRSEKRKSGYRTTDRVWQSLASISELVTDTQKKKKSLPILRCNLIPSPHPIRSTCLHIRHAIESILLCGIPFFSSHMEP